jgi:hypothetical protein
MSTRPASECRSPARPHGQALPGQLDRLCSVAQNVIQMPSTHDRDQGPRTLAPRKQDPSRRGLHSVRGKLGRCAIAPTGSRHVDLAAAHATRALALGRVDIGLASLHRPLCLQAECCGSKIRHSASLSSQSSLQRLAPRLVTTRYTVGKSAMASTAPSFGETSSGKGKRYSYLPALAVLVMVSRSATDFSLPLPSAASASLRQITPSRCRRTFRQPRGATTGSGLRLCVQDDLLQGCVLLALKATTRAFAGQPRKNVSIVVVRIFIDTQNRLVALHSALVSRLT